MVMVEEEGDVVVCIQKVLLGIIGSVEVVEGGKESTGEGRGEEVEGGV